MTPIAPAHPETAAANVLDETLGGDRIGLAAIARMLSADGEAPVRQETIWRWANDGVRTPDGSRVKLETVRFGRRWVSSKAAVRRFVAATSAQPAGPSP